jgi:hypothetical protein
MIVLAFLQTAQTERYAVDAQYGFGNLIQRDITTGSVKNRNQYREHLDKHQ